jgi:hypothetical protein
LAESQRLHLGYLLPLIFSYLRGLPLTELPRASKPFDWRFRLSGTNGNSRESDAENFASEYQKAAVMHYEELQQRMENRPAAVAEWAVLDSRDEHAIEQPIWAVENYPKLVQTISRFKNPRIVSAVGTA